MDNINEKFELLTKEDLKDLFANKGLSDDALEKISSGNDWENDPSWQEWLNQETPEYNFEYNVGDRISFGAGWEGIIIGYHYPNGRYIVQITHPYPNQHTTVAPNSISRRL